MSTYMQVPLFDRHAHETLFISTTGAVSVADVEHRVSLLARCLPDTRYVMNLCLDRHNFMLAFCAIIASGKVNLLPPNRQPDTLRELAHRYDGPGIAHDGHAVCVPGSPTVDVRDCMLDRGGYDDARLASAVADGPRPGTRRDALAAISFTSGSTGKPRANKKTWGTLVDGTDINRRALFGTGQDALSLLATVPPQHMYGLELSVLLPMRAPLSVVAGQPLYPADVIAALEATPAPRALVTTPAHLRALLADSRTLPKLARIFSATAPLDADTARQVEVACSARVTEIYGCSEVGSIAHRRTATEQDWQVFDGLTLTVATGIESGRPEARIVAPHLTEPAELQDNIDVLDSRRFRLRGRRDDLINIAGKRGSLADVNRRLLAIPGVMDGVAFQPADGRLAALVVAPDLNRQQVLAALRRVLDPAFLPRPLLFVERLPRQASSKLRRADLLAMLDPRQRALATAALFEEAIS